MSRLKNRITKPSSPEDPKTTHKNRVCAGLCNTFVQPCANRANSHRLVQHVCANLHNLHISRTRRETAESLCLCGLQLFCTVVFGCAVMTFPPVAPIRNNRSCRAPLLYRPVKHPAKMRCRKMRCRLHRKSSPGHPRCRQT